MKLTKTTPVYIVIPEKPTTREVFASEELSKYLCEIPGIKAELLRADVSFQQGEASHVCLGPVPIVAGLNIGIFRRKEGLFGDIERDAEFLDDVKAVARSLDAESVHDGTEFHGTGQKHGR